MVRVSNYAITIDLKMDNKFLLVNGLYGYVDIVSKRTAEYIERCRKGIIEGTIEEERELYSFLVERKYLVDEYEEEMFRIELEKRLEARHLKKIDSPSIATFIPSYNCNFECPYCFEKGLKKKSPIITKAQVDTVFSLYHRERIPYIRFYGGEPFLPEHTDIIEYIIERGEDSEFSAVTNGYYLEEYIPLFIGKKVRAFQVTFDGDEAVHDKTRVLCGGGKTFTKILRGVETALERGIPIRIRMNLSKENIESCYKFKSWIVDYLGNTELVTFDMQGLFNYQMNDSLDISERIIKESSKGTPNILLQTMPRIARFMYDGTPLRPIISACEYGDGDRIFDPYGDIYTCYLGVGNINKRIGCYFPEVKLFDGNMLRRTALDIEECKSCKYIFLCGGGCPNPVISDEGNCMVPNCSSIYNIMENIIPMIYRWKVRGSQKV